MCNSPVVVGAVVVVVVAVVVVVVVTVVNYGIFEFWKTFGFFPSSQPDFSILEN